MSTAAIEPSAVTDAHRKQFEEQGYFILESVIPQEHVEMLREECAKAIDLIHADMDAKGVDTIGISHRDSRYFISLYQESPRVREFLFSPVMLSICQATIGPRPYLFFEQYVIKAAEKGMKFGWHQDSGYLGPDYPPYLTCWCALDDVDEENGTIYVLPYDRAGTRGLVAHVHDAGTNDLVGYFGDDPGIPVVVPAGSVAVFSSLVFHRSGPNTTNGIRRIYLAQYSAEPMMAADSHREWNPEGSRPWIPGSALTS